MIYATDVIRINCAKFKCDRSDLEFLSYIVGYTRVYFFRTRVYTVSVGPGGYHQCVATLTDRERQNIIEFQSVSRSSSTMTMMMVIVMMLSSESERRTVINN